MQHNQTSPPWDPSYPVTLGHIKNPDYRSLSPSIPPNGPGLGHHPRPTPISPVRFVPPPCNGTDYAAALALVGVFTPCPIFPLHLAGTQNSQARKLARTSQIDDATNQKIARGRRTKRNQCNPKHTQKQTCAEGQALAYRRCYSAIRSVIGVQIVADHARDGGLNRWKGEGRFWRYFKYLAYLVG
jgi:hypothetical protein